MSSKYLLSCACGTKHAVDVAQAGMEIRCHCGASLTVPTLRGLTALPRAEAPLAAPRRAVWTRRHGVMFLGASITGLSTILVAYLWLSIPAYPITRINSQAIRLDIERYTLRETMMTWESLRVPLDDAEMSYPPILAWQQAVEEKWRGLRAAGVLAVGGAVLFVAAWLSPAAFGAARSPQRS